MLKPCFLLPGKGSTPLDRARANARVLDFSCVACREDYELKATKGRFFSTLTPAEAGAQIVWLCAWARKRCVWLVVRLRYVIWAPASAGVSGFWEGWDALFLGRFPVLRVHADAKHVVEEVAPGRDLLFKETGTHTLFQSR